MRYHYPLRLVAPWYRWQRQFEANGTHPADSRPVFLMTDSPDVNPFLKNPQRALVFESDVDTVQISEGSPYSGKMREMMGRRTYPTGVRKLFRDTHKRSYLVVCELHCLAPGFPDAKKRLTEDLALDIRFVVRRRKPPNQTDAGLAVLWKTYYEGAIGYFRARQLPSGTTNRVASLPAAPPSPLGQGAALSPGLTPATGLSLARSHLRELERLDYLPRQVQRWVPEVFDGQGRWMDIEDETPQVPDELTFPLFPLFVDPADKEHSSLQAQLIFGVVPTGSGLFDMDGNAQFDGDGLYEIRAFVRDSAPPPGKPEGCPGPLVWSEPTEPYKIAAHFDLHGTSNLVVNAEMPDLPQLAAQAASLKPIEAASVRLKTPAESTMTFTPGSIVPLLGSGETGGSPKMCATSIPLVTIVATFLFELISPIVIYIFSLYYLLPKKVCIPLGGPAAGSDTDEALDELLGFIPTRDAFGSGEDHAIEQMKLEFTEDERAEELDRMRGGTGPLVPTDRSRWEVVLTERPTLDEFQVLGGAA